MTVRDNGSERSGMVVVVPTTAGAIQVMGLRWSQKIPSSRVVLGNETADQCERWTKDYNNLLRPGDPLRTLMGLHEGGGYRLVVSSEIDHGRSWMMPVSASHCGAALGEPIHNDLARAKLMVWTTGAIDFAQPDTARDAKVVENDYHLVSKIDHSRELFAKAAHAGTPVLCVLPKGPDAERAATVLGKVLGQQPHHVAIADSLAELTAPLDAFLTRGDFNAPPPNKNQLAIYAPRVDKTATDDAPQPAAAAAAPPKAEPPPLAGTQAVPPYIAAAAAAAAKPSSSLPLGALIGLGVVALGIGGAYFALTGLKTNGSGGTQTPVAVAQPQNDPPAAQPPVQNPPTQTPTAQPPAAHTPPGSVAARLTLLVAPAGSSCQAQIYNLSPRFTETVVEIAGDKPVVEIDGANLCGLAVSGANFQRGTGSGAVQSLSTGNRIVFNQSGSIVPPTLSLTGAALEKIEIKLK
jgi:hypothetical protein